MGAYVYISRRYGSSGTTVFTTVSALQPPGPSPEGTKKRTIQQSTIPGTLLAP